MQAVTSSGSTITKTGTFEELLQEASDINAVDPIKKLKIKRLPDLDRMPKGIIASGKPKKKKR